MPKQAALFLIALLLLITGCGSAPVRQADAASAAVRNHEQPNIRERFSEVFGGPFSTLKFTSVTESATITTYYAIAGKNAIEVVKGEQDTLYRFPRHMIVFMTGGDSCDSVILCDSGTLRQAKDGGFTDFQMTGKTQMINNCQLADIIKQRYGVEFAKIAPDYEIGKKRQ